MKKLYKSYYGDTTIAKIGFVVGVAICWTLMAVCWWYAINFWLVWAGSAAVFAWWWGLLLALVPKMGRLSIPVAAVTFIISLFI